MRLGKIKIAEDMLLRILDYADATVREATYNIESQTLDITLEGSDMPVHRVGDSIIVVTPLYIQHQDALGNRITVRQRDWERR